MMIRLVHLILIGCVWQNSVATAQQADSTSSRQAFTSFHSPVISLAINQDKQSIFAASGGTVFELGSKLEIKNRIVTELDFVCDMLLTDEHLVVAGGNAAEHGMIELYSLSDWKLQKRKLVHDDVIHSIKWKNDNLVTASADSKLHVLAGPEFETVGSFTKHSKRVRSVESIRGTEWIISGGLDDTLKMWSVKTGKMKRELTHHQGDVVDIKQFVPADSESNPRLPLIASVSRDRTVRFWQPTIGRLVRFKRFDAEPTCCCWIPNTDRILVGFDNGQLWDVSSVSLESKEVANVGERIFSIAILEKSKYVIGTQRKVTMLLSTSGE